MRLWAFPFRAPTLTGARNARLTLEAGFTTVRNVGADGYSDVALRDAINAGDVPGPRMLVSGPPLGITEGTATRTCCRSNITSLAEALPTAWKPCSTKSARPSSTALT